MDSNHLDLKEELFKAAKRGKRNRIVRLILHPWKMLYPQFLRSFGRSKEIETRTFWGGTMRIVFPELVSQNIWRYGYFEEDVCLYMLHYLKKGMTFVDIGAHFGFFSLLGSYLTGHTGKVLTFEPLTSTYDQLLKNIANYTKCPNIKAYNVAAYDENIELTLNDYGLEYSAYNSVTGLRRDNSMPVPKEILVKARRFDDVMNNEGLKQIDLIKIDAESSELHVLKGMTQTIAHYKPTIIMEVGDFTVNEVPSSGEIITFLLQTGYSPYEIRNNEIVPHNIEEHYGHANLLFINNNTD